MNDAPHDERPGGTVPEPANEHHDHQVDGGADSTRAIATERNVEVVAKKRRKRDVPAAPEVGETDRGVRKPKVILQVKAEAERGANRARGIPGEVEEDLSRESKYAGPGIESGKGATIGEDLFRRAGEHHVSEDGLFEQTERHEQQAPDETTGIWRRWVGGLRQEIRGPHNRAGDQLGKERDCEDEIPQRAGGLRGAAINVQRVRERVERVE